jgi:hypothetical protein
MFDLILKNCLSNKNYKHKISAIRVFAIIGVFAILGGGIFAFCKSLNCSANGDLIRFVIAIVDVILIFVFAYFISKFIEKREDSESIKYKNCYVAADKIVNDIGKEIDPVFQKSHYFIEVAINEGEEKLKKAKENSLILKIVTIIIMPFILAFLEMDLADPRIIFVLFVLLVFTLLSAYFFIDKVLSYIFQPMNSSFEREKLLNILKLILAKKKQTQENRQNEKSEVCV